MIRPVMCFFRGLCTLLIGNTLSLVILFALDKCRLYLLGYFYVTCSTIYSFFAWPPIIVICNLIRQMHFIRGICDSE